MQDDESEEEEGGEDGEEGDESEDDEPKSSKKRPSALGKRKVGPSSRPDPKRKKGRGTYLFILSLAHISTRPVPLPYSNSPLVCSCSVLHPG
jgi:hypothetical protein